MVTVVVGVADAVGDDVGVAERVEDGVLVAGGDDVGVSLGSSVVVPVAV